MWLHCGFSPNDCRSAGRGRFNKLPSNSSHSKRQQTAAVANLNTNRLNNRIWIFFFLIKNENKGTRLANCLTFSVFIRTDRYVHLARSLLGIHLRCSLAVFDSKCSLAIFTHSVHCIDSLTVRTTGWTFGCDGGDPQRPNESCGIHRATVYRREDHREGCERLNVLIGKLRMHPMHCNR